MAFKSLLTTDQMYQADALTIAAGTAGIDLMESAGQAVFKEITKRWQPRPTLVLCGPGNNGGDGFVVARLLAASGWPVTLGLLGDAGKLGGDAALAAGRWSAPIEPLGPDLLRGAPLVVDALFGAGLDREISGPARLLVEQINSDRLDCVAVDVPSGVQGDTGNILGAAPRCKLTVTFFRAKPAHYLMPARDLRGDLCIADIGIDRAVLKQITPRTFLNLPEIWGAGFPWPAADDHKFSRGHLVVAGGSQMTGAARLVARAGRRVGAGLVTVAADPQVWPIYANDQPGLLVSQVSTQQAFQQLCVDSRVTALVIGPGFGRGPQTVEWVLAALATGKPLVLDADALSVFEGQADRLFDALHENAVLTPHAGEFARLFVTSRDKPADVRKAAARSGACLLHKGPDTMICDPAGALYVNDTGTPYLATAGSGDVLAGLIGGLLAQGMAPLHAACAGAWMHGRAAEDFGPGLIAEDIPELIPKMTRTIINL